MTVGLVVRNLDAAYGAIPVVHGVSFEVVPGEVRALLGRNGAGKTTTLRAIAGLLRRVRGEVELDGRPLLGQSSVRIATAGLVYVPEGHRVFPSLSVDENLRLGAFCRRRDRQGIAADLERVLDLFPALRGRERQPAGQLSGGEQQMVALGQALMARPRILLVDEPSAGLAPLAVEAVFAALRRLADEGLGVLLVEQAVDRALHVATRAWVMDQGRILLEGDARTLAGDGRVAAVVLGDRAVAGP